jgi:PhoH-like ATPase
MSEKNAIIADTNVFIHDPSAIDVLREGGNTLYIPMTVILELDKLKDKPDIGIDARDALRRIEHLNLEGDPSLKIYSKRPNLKTLKEWLDPNSPDHQIIAVAHTIVEENQKDKVFAKVKLVSRDRPVRLLAYELISDGVVVEDYYRDETEELKHQSPKEINVCPDEISDNFTFKYDPKTHNHIEENEGVICFSNAFGKEWKDSFVAIKKGDVFRIVNRDVHALGLKPYSLNGNGPNWQQYIALGQLLDPGVELVFLQGGAGTGKTLLALATAIEQRKMYQQIIITRPMIHLEDEDRMGFLPGDEIEKMTPWLRPILRAFSFLSNLDGFENKKLIDRLKDEGKIVFEPLDYIRGMTYHKDILIVDEAQNLTPHQVKTIITRAGEKAKIIFTGDLGQIDRRRRLDRKSSGLTYAIKRMMGHSLVGVTTFRDSVRSRLAGLAEERL